MEFPGLDRDRVKIRSFYGMSHVGRVSETISRLSAVPRCVAHVDVPHRAKGSLPRPNRTFKRSRLLSEREVVRFGLSGNIHFADKPVGPS